jgi:serine/threonine-protein kinase
VSDSRWQRIEDIFHRAVELAPEARSAFLDKMCAGDASLRKEVESLLAHETEDGSTFRGVVGDDAPRTIAHYRILGKLGEGGMGAVYRATDTKLGREVAIKVLPDAFAGDRDRLARFTREAKVLASLNHPNIAAIYGVEDRALIMELVEGHDLSGPLPIATALNYARQMAEALDAAHEKGIVHRDLKPANIRINPTGVVKVLDFGLAAVPGRAAGDSDPSRLPTLTEASTRAGIIMGTAAYMSPEQASGKAVDKRADIWSFGVVLWELLTGKRLFRGETVTLTLSEVLRGPIDFDQLPSETPAAIRGLLRRCLDRNPRNRLRDIGEARIAIEAALAGEMPFGDPALAESARAHVLPWAAAGLCLVLATGAGYLWVKSRAPEIRAAQFTLDAVGGSTFANVHGGSAVSPDGRFVVFGLAGNGQKKPVLWLRPIDSLNARELPGTEGGDFPFWSPDGQSLAFFAEDKLKRIALDGGTPAILCEAKPPGPAGGAWNQHGLILFAGEGGLYRVSASGGVAARIIEADAARHETAHGFPQFLPDGRRFLYFIQSPDLGVQGVYAAAVDSPQQRRRILSTDHKALYAPPRGSHPGLLLWLREQTLFAQPFDIAKLKLEGEPARLAENISITSTSTDVDFPSRAAFWLSDAGVLRVPYGRHC